MGDTTPGNGTRSYSTFNNLEDDCGGMDVTSQNKDNNVGPIEESMRKYCEDKKTVMFKPEVGMEFYSSEEAYQFYNMYSWVAGFSIRLGENYTNKKKERTMQEYLCQRQGTDNETKYSTTRCGCKAMMRVSINDNSVWYVKKFVEFVSMMGGKAPQTMLTDQSLAMTIAIRENLLDTNHRWCKWHVLRKAQEALGHVHRVHNTFSDDFNKVVNHMLTPEEFEAGWGYLTRTYDLSDNPFMIRAYEYTKLIDDRERADDEAEKNKSQKICKPLFGYPIEKHASMIYTPSVFKLFKAELRKTSSYIMVSSTEGTSYEVMHVDAENRDAWSRVNFTITVDPAIGLHKCQCRLYEHFGVICCHIMLVMIQSGVMTIPDCHIMKRWTVRAREGTVGMSSRSVSGMKVDDLRTLRHKNLYMHVLDLVSAGQYDETTAQVAIKYVDLAKKKIDEYRSSISQTCQVGYNLTASTNVCNTNSLECIDETGDNSSCGLQPFDRSRNYGIEVSSIKAPVMKEKLGRPSNKRFLTRFDSSIRKTKGKINGIRRSAGNGGRTGVHQTRFCSCCRSPDHDIRTCPNRKDHNQKPTKRGKTTFASQFKF
ncbi:hypothetical protein QYE76_044156 [Lolium multiflorum]|uniref:Protein FAR1-RELATED SEQUENCE n=1 Tax=Lolium multiflorum TaxID=4521 RepID=A0AAD8TK44_LOLMU|nr:hypothetical protein QYE76_044156 [Lolium multiflorum]